MAQTISLATRSTCRRRMVGCTLVSADNRQLAAGYNGSAPGAEHCLLHPCAGSKYPSGEGRHLCESSHAEISAMVNLTQPDKVHAAYITTAPCGECTKALLLLPYCRRIVFVEDYPDMALSESRWTKAGRLWEQIERPLAAMHMALNLNDVAAERRIVAAES